MPVEMIEGEGRSKLRHVIRELGYNKDVDIEFATVLSPPPKIKLKVDGLPFDLDEEDVIICEHLLEQTRTVTISGGKISQDTTLDGDPSHSHKITSFLITDAEIKINQSLKAGDRVIVVSYGAGQNYIVLDRIGGA